MLGDIKFIYTLVYSGSSFRALTLSLSRPWEETEFRSHLVSRRAALASNTSDQHFSSSTLETMKTLSRQKYAMGKWSVKNCTSVSSSDPFSFVISNFYPSAKPCSNTRSSYNFCNCGCVHVMYNIPVVYWIFWSALLARETAYTWSTHCKHFWKAVGYF